jgi:hypothetical protein
VKFAFGVRAPRFGARSLLCIPHSGVEIRSLDSPVHLPLAGRAASRFFGNECTSEIGPSTLPYRPFDAEGTSSTSRRRRGTRS